MSRDYAIPTVREQLSGSAEYIQKLDALRDERRGDPSKATAYALALADAAEQLVSVHALASKLLRIIETEGYQADRCRSSAMTCDLGSHHLNHPVRQHGWWHHDPSGVWWRRTNGGSVELNYGSTQPPN